MFGSFLIFLILFSFEGNSNLSVDCSNPPYPNIGHRLCGDIKGLKDNDIKNIKKCDHLQSLPCFSGWELDIHSSEDSLMVKHDSDQKGVKLKHIYHEMKEVDIIKPIFLDLKDIRWRDRKKLIRYHNRFKKLHESVNFLMSRKRQAKSRVDDYLKGKGYPIGSYGEL